VNKNDFDKKFSLAKTLTNIRNTSDATTHSSESIAIIFMINHSVFTTMLAIAGTEVKTVKYCAG
jgi:hypothetical protein